MTHNRMRRIGDQIQQELAQLLIMKVHDPRLAYSISITAVDVSPDMANATVFITADVGTHHLSPRIHAKRFSSAAMEGDISSEHGANTSSEKESEKNLGAKYISPRQEILYALNNAAGFFRRELAHSLNLRVTPRLRFVYDKSVAHAHHLDRLINAVNPPEQETQDE